jgi:hypothetical protein
MKIPINHGSTLFLRTAVALISLIVIALCVVALPAGIQSDNMGGYRTIFLGMYVTVIPFFIALYHTLKLLDYIDHNQAFSTASVRALKNIKYCALAISGLYTAGLPYIYMVADKDDAPGVVVIGLLLAFAPAVVAVFAALMQKLLQNAIDIKAENDLTV